MTTISPLAKEFHVSVRSGTLTHGQLNATRNLAEAREQLTQIRRAFPDSVLQQHHGDGGWADATADDLDGVADVNAALALAEIFDAGASRITWELSHLEPGKLTGRARSKEQVEEYARLFGLTVRKDDKAYPNMQATGSFQHVEVEVYCHIRTEQPAEVKV